jgi:hypothetical protein
MSEIEISLEMGPDGQPAGELRRGSGRPVAFTGWLELVRALEEELEAQAADPSPDD